MFVLSWFDYFWFMFNVCGGLLWGWFWLVCFGVGFSWWVGF